MNGSAYTGIVEHFALCPLLTLSHWVSRLIDTRVLIFHTSIFQVGDTIVSAPCFAKPRRCSPFLAGSQSTAICTCRSTPPKQLSEASYAGAWLAEKALEVTEDQRYEAGNGHA